MAKKQAEGGLAGGIASGLGGITRGLNPAKSLSRGLKPKSPLRGLKANFVERAVRPGGMARGGAVRGDGCAMRGKTRGKIV